MWVLPFPQTHPLQGIELSDQSSRASNLLFAICHSAHASLWELEHYWELFLLFTKARIFI